MNVKQIFSRKAINMVTVNVKSATEDEVKRLIDDAPLKLVPLNKGGKRGLYF